MNEILRKEMITLVVPVFNSAPFLPPFFNCLHNQSFSSFKIIFVYDKSSDDTLALISAFSKKNQKFSCSILLKEKKEGVGRARDYAIESGLIDTKYVLFLDSDDQFEPSFLQALFDSAEKNDSDIAMCGYDRKDEASGRVLSTEMVHNPTKIETLSSSPIIPYLNPAPWNKLYRFEIIKEARFIYPGGGEDEMFFLEALPNCKKISFVNEVLYHYLIHPGSVISKTDVKLYEKAKEGYKSVVSFYKTHGDKYLIFWSLCEACIFIRFGIGMTTRTCLSVPKQKGGIIKETKSFLDAYLSGWRKNPLVSFRTSIRNGIKPLFIWRCRLLYKINCFRVFVFDYSLFTNVFHKDIKW
jgi:glycosyltransferase EpsH